MYSWQPFYDTSSIEHFILISMNETIFASARVRQHLRRTLNVSDRFYGFDEIRELVSDGAQLVDVRTPAEFAEGALPGAVNMPLQYLTVSSNQLNRSKPVLLYCGSGKQGGTAKMVLDCIGFENVINIGSYLQFRDCAEDLHAVPA